VTVCEQSPTLNSIIVFVSAKRAATQSPRSFSDMQSEIAGDHNNHDHYADDVENIHCFAPIETLACSLRKRRR
jgi:hypothetical protein